MVSGSSPVRLDHSRIDPRNPTSNQELGLLAEVRELEKSGCDRIIRDLGQSGETNLIESVEWQKIAERIERGDVLKVWSQSRLGRENYEVGFVIGRLTKRGITVHILEEGRVITDMDDFGQNATMTLKALTDHNERVEIIKWTKKANDLLREYGAKLGWKPALTAKQIEQIREFHERGFGYTVIGKLVQHRLKDGRLVDTAPDAIKLALTPDYVTRDEWEAHNRAVKQKIKRTAR
jgi:DNA invertase Pin-like site-specific DNA recombinase